MPKVTRFAVMVEFQDAETRRRSQHWVSGLTAKDGVSTVEVGSSEALAFETHGDAEAFALILAAFREFEQTNRIEAVEFDAFVPDEDGFLVRAKTRGAHGQPDGLHVGVYRDRTVHFHDVHRMIWGMCLRSKDGYNDPVKVPDDELDPAGFAVNLVVECYRDTARYAYMYSPHGDKL